MSSMPRAAILLVVAVIGVASVLPPALYWTCVGRVPTRSVREALAELSVPAAAAVLVDVRPADDFRDSHLEAATNWPFADIRALASPDQVPERLRGKTLLLLCPSGLSSALAARRLRERGVADVWNIDGGMTAWVAEAGDLGGSLLTRLRTASGETTPLPFQAMSPVTQWVAFASGFIIKPAYMLLSLVLIILLWRQERVELKALRWGLTCFLLGETACAVNYLAYGDLSYLVEYLHSLGMALCFGFVTFATIEGMDRWLIRYTDSEETCAALPLCRKCIKYTDAPCGLRRTFYVLIPAAMILAFMPLLADLETPSYNTRILGTPYNYSHPVVYQVFETRYLPVVAILLFGASLVVLLVKRADPVFWSKLLFAAGMGALGFSLLRLFIFAPYKDEQVWFVLWEEMTELMFVAGAAIVLWIFRHGLFAESKGRPASA